MVAHIDDIDPAGGIDGDAVRRVELAIATAKATPLQEKRSGTGEFLDPVIIPVHHVHVARGADGNAHGLPELPSAAAIRAPRRHELPGAREFAHTVGASVC